MCNSTLEYWLAFCKSKHYGDKGNGKKKLHVGLKPILCYEVAWRKVALTGEGALEYATRILNTTRHNGNIELYSGQPTCSFNYWIFSLMALFAATTNHRVVVKPEF